MSENKIFSIDGGKKKKDLEPSYVKLKYTDEEEEILQADSWGESSELQGFLIFLRNVDTDSDALVGFRNSSLIKKVDIVDREGVPL